MYLRPIRNQIMKQETQNEFLGALSQEIKGHQVTNIKAIVRIKPLLPSQPSHPSCVTCTHNTLEINGTNYNTIKKRLDRVFGPDETQSDIYKYISECIEKSMDGYNITIFSYGQTGSGKTHTMFGNDWDRLVSPDSNKLRQRTFYGDIGSDINFAGVIPRCINHLFNGLLKGKKNVTVYCSFLQLYNEKLVDLLEDSPSQQLVIRENKQDGIYVQGLSEHKVRSVSQCMSLMQSGQQNRAVRQTSMNVKSSRSHIVFQLLIEQVFPQTKSFRRSKINLCDLAGSEKINKLEETQLQHLKQLKNINLSLTSLGKIINTLSSSRPSVASYRQSKLTRLLQDSLGGNAFTTLIANIHGKQSCIEETLSTLKFVERARHVVTQVTVKTFQNRPQIKQLQQEVHYLKEVIKTNSRVSTLKSIHSQDQLQRRIWVLEEENKRLRQDHTAEQGREGLLGRLMQENRVMKKELEKKRGQRIVHDRLDSEVTLNFSKPQGDIDSHCNTSHTVNKVRNPSCRYSFNSSLSKKFGTLPIEQNLIVRRLQKLQQLKHQNRQKLDRQLKQLERSEEVAMKPRLEGRQTATPYIIQPKRRSFKRH